MKIEKFKEWEYSSQVRIELQDKRIERLNDETYLKKTVIKMIPCKFWEKIKLMNLEIENIDSSVNERKNFKAERKLGDTYIVYS